MQNDHHTKHKGDIGVSFVICDLTKKGYFISIPLTEHAPYDLIVTRDSSVYRIQVKYRTLTNGTMEVKFGNTWGNMNKGAVRTPPPSKDDVDVYAITNGSVIAYVKYSQIETNSINIRVEEPKPSVGWRKEHRYIADYQLL